MNETIEQKIELIETDIANAYNEAEAKGAEMPQVQGSANLADTIATIQVGINPTGTLLITENGNQINIRDKEFVDVAVPPEIPIDENSPNSLFFGIDEDGFYYSDNVLDKTSISFGLDEKGIYVIGEDI